MPTPAPAVKAKALTDADHDLINLIEQYYTLHSGFPTLALLIETYPHLEAQPWLLRFNKALANPQFRYALSVRGIVVEEAATKGVLTELQLAVAATMFDYVDNRTFRKKLSELGVSSQTYQNWLNDPAFQSYVTQRGELLLSNHQHEAHYALVERVRAGDIGAIKYYNEVTGRYRPNADSKQIDVNEVLMRVLEIIQKHVRDANVLSAIADDMLLLGNRVTGTASLITPPVGSSVVPGSVVNTMQSANRQLANDLDLNL